MCQLVHKSNQYAERAEVDFVYKGTDQECCEIETGMGKTVVEKAEVAGLSAVSPLKL